MCTTTSSGRSAARVCAATDGENRLRQHCRLRCLPHRDAGLWPRRWRSEAEEVAL
ncbi:MAG: hypothetical protein ACM3UX_01175 [Candidatus Woesearchaeota archaeon]